MRVETIDQLIERAIPALQRLEYGFAETGTVLQEQADQWRRTGDDWAESLRGGVREHPLVAVAAAFAVGALISRLAR